MRRIDEVASSPLGLASPVSMGYFEGGWIPDGVVFHVNRDS